MSNFPIDFCWALQHCLTITLPTTSLRRSCAIRIYETRLWNKCYSSNIIQFGPVCGCGRWYSLAASTNQNPNPSCWSFYIHRIANNSHTVSSLPFYHPYSHFNAHLCECAVAIDYQCVHPSVCQTRDPHPNG